MKVCSGEPLRQNGAIEPKTTAPTIAEILEALSLALDITEGAPRGHAARTALIAGKIADRMGLSPGEKDSLFYAALLKDAGCSTNSARIYQVFGGDDLLAKRNVKFVDWSDPKKSIGYAIRNADPGASVLKRAKRIIGMIGPPGQVMDEVTAARCFRGADIATQLGFDEMASKAIRHLDEHWDGKGSPSHLSGQAIPLLARILCLAQTLELFAAEFGPLEGCEMVRQRTGRWFDPEVAGAAVSMQDEDAFWSFHRRHFEGEDVHVEPPASVGAATDADVDQVCEAFASIVDAKSTFTAEHSSRVMDYSMWLGESFGFDGERLTTLRRAALLHDIGKLGVPNSILDKPGKLDEAEFARVRLHPRFSFDILSRVKGFARIAEIAANHHERLDGKGYWRNLSADQLDTDMRVVAAADVYDALTANRPYRDALSHEEAILLMEKDVGKALDPDCVASLAANQPRRDRGQTSASDFR